MQYRSDIETALLHHDTVSDFAVLERRNERGELEIVAYVVPTEPISPEELARSLQSEGPPPTVVRVSAIPRQASGEVDEDALMRLPVVDSELARRWQERLEALALPGRSAVVITEVRERPLPLHLEDVLPARGRDVEERDERSREPESPLRARASGWVEKRPALSEGGALEVEGGAPRTLAELLIRAASGGEGVVYVGRDGSRTVQTYEELLSGARRVLSGLRSLGLEPGERILLQLGRHRDFLEAFWASVLGGFIPVPMAVPASTETPAFRETFSNALRTLDRPLVLVPAEAVPELTALAEALGLAGSRVQAIEACRLEPDERVHPAEPTDAALFMLTSGSTGAPKAVVLSHANILSRTSGSKQMNGFSSRDVSLNWMPLDHVAGLIYFHIRDVHLGCRQVQLVTDAVVGDPLVWLSEIEKNRATVTFAPNFAYGLVNEREDAIRNRRFDLSSLRFVLNGAEPIVAKTARRFLQLLGPHGLSKSAMHPAWGMSETSSGVTYSDSFDLETTSDEDTFVEVGRPIPGLSMRVVDSDGEIVEEGQVGALQVKGNVVTRGYFRNPQATAEAFTPDGWFRTGDLATLEKGRLTITGREKDVVIVNGVNYYSHAIESAVEDIEGVVPSFTAASAVRIEGGNTDRLAVFYVPRTLARAPLTAQLSRIRQSVRTRVGISPDYVVPLETTDIPKTSLGKIQRTRLADELLSGKFDETLKRVDRLSGNRNTVPDWFFRKTWRSERVRPGAPLTGRRPVLIFADDNGVHARLAEALAERNVPSILVHEGSGFERVGPLRYRIDPGSSLDYRSLLDALGRDGHEIQHVFHLWGFRPYTGEVSNAADVESEQPRGSLSLLWLAQAFSAKGAPSRLGVTVGSSYTASVRPEELVAFERRPVVAFVKSIPPELPWFQCRHVDLDELDRERAARLLLIESELHGSSREVAYRSGTRLVAALERVELDSPGGRQLFTPGAMILVAGGLGGVGQHVSRFLLRELGARLLLIGRRELGDIRESESVWNGLRRERGEVAYQPVDVSDRAALSALVRRYEAQWKTRLSGAIHLVGDYRECLVAEETKEGLDAVLAPRAEGAFNLLSLLRERGGGALVSSSSVAAFFGGAGMASYSAASDFLVALTEHRSKRRDIRHVTFQWSNWEEIGQARGYRSELPRAHGFLPMSAERALSSFAIGLAHEESRLLLGLDSENRHVRPFLDRPGREPTALDSVTVYCGEKDSLATALALDSIEIPDRFGAPSRCRVSGLEEIPLTDSGAIDFEELKRLAREGGRRPTSRTSPRPGAESRLAAIWKSVLGAHEVSREDDFFELGGDSLLAVRLSGQVRDAFGVELSLKTIFESPSLAALSEALSSEAPATEQPHGADEKVIELDPDSLLSRLDEMADDEVDELLQRLADEDEARRRR